MSKMKLVLDVVQGLRNLADSLETLADAALHDEPSTTGQPPAKSDTNIASGQPPITPNVNAPESEPPKLTMVELRAFVAEKSTPENRPRIKAILEKLGAKKLTELAEDQYPALMREMEAL